VLTGARGHQPLRQERTGRRGPYLTNNPYAATLWYIVSKSPNRSFLTMAPLWLGKRGAVANTAQS